MKKTFLALTLAASLGLAACSNPGDEVVVTSSVGDLTQQDFYKEIKNLAGEQLLEQIMIEKILEDKYDVSDKDVTAEFDALKEQYGEQFDLILATNGLSEDALKANIRFNLLKEQAEKDVEVTDAEIKAYYDQASKELKARHILVEDEETAKKAIERIKAGEDFATVAKEMSKDPGSASEGGELGWFTVGKMIPEFNDAAYALELNTISEPVKSPAGYHVIEVTDKRDVKDYGTLEEKKDEIRDAIAEQKADWNKTVAKLLKEAKVEVKDADLKGAFKAYNIDEEKAKK
ncbi:peptidylprolyl isomerase [Solibacillus sp. CAU 1738]|uniref:peptidylprolyl isomerase n=1 Tax=Solibacillus sp. CAU 1738 TaxID=3140363 RepID=UPI00325FE1F6